MLIYWLPELQVPMQYMAVWPAPLHTTQLRARPALEAPLSTCPGSPGFRSSQDVLWPPHSY